MSASTASALDERRWWPYYTPHWASRAAAAARWRLGTEGSSCRSTRTPRRGRPISTATSASRTCRPGSSPGPSGRRRPAPLPPRARRPRGAAREAALARPPRRDRGATGGDPSPRCHGRLLADRVRGDSRRLRRDVHRRDLRRGARRRRRMGGRRRQAAERPPAARGLREDPHRRRPHRLPRLRRRVDTRAAAVLHRRPLGEDGRPGDRLPGAVHARRLRVRAG